MKFNQEIYDYRSSRPSCATILIPKNFPAHKLNHELNQKLKQYSETQKTCKKLLMVYIRKFLSKLYTYSESPKGYIILLSDKHQEMIESNIVISCFEFFRNDKFELDFFNERDNLWLIGWVIGGRINFISYDEVEMKDLEKVEFPIMSSTRKGGASSSRFDRIRDESKYEFVKKCSEKLKCLNKTLNPKKIILIGVDEYKKQILNRNELSDIKHKTIIDADKEIKNEKDIREYIVQFVEKENLDEEKRICNIFFKEVEKGADKISFNKKDILSYPQLYELIVTFDEDISRELKSSILLTTRTSEGKKLNKFGSIIAKKYY